MTALSTGTTTTTAVSSPTSPPSVPSSVIDAEDHELFNPESTEATSDEPSDFYTRDRFLGVHHRRDSQGRERFFGHTAAVSLFASIKRLLEEFLSDAGSETEAPGNTPLHPSFSSLIRSNPLLRTELQKDCDSFPFEHSHHGANYTSDSKPLACPPRSFLDASIDCYLSEVNTIFPVFDEVSLRESIDDHYTKPVGETDEARSLCFNNIILLTLGLKSRLARRNGSHVNKMDDDWLTSFVNNSRRALQNLERFFHPRLVNAQGLVTLVSYTIAHRGS